VGTAVFDDPPVLCGHRGSGRGEAGGHAENTLPSFLAAAEAGLRWVEVDARRTADAMLVARHDPVTEDGRDIAATAADELGLMCLTELLDDLPADVAVNVDVKSSLEDALLPREQTTAALVADLVAGADRRVLVTSFDPAALLIVRERAPALPLGLLTWTRFPLRNAVAAAAHLGVEVVTANVESFDGDAERAVRVAHDAGLEVGAWCPTANERERLLEIGVDCLVIDLEGDGGPASPPATPAA
jgi:glycerophosphoryl diester phosphodiesterase